MRRPRKEGGWVLVIQCDLETEGSSPLSEPHTSNNHHHLKSCTATEVIISSCTSHLALPRNTNSLPDFNQAASRVLTVDHHRIPNLPSVTVLLMAITRVLPSEVTSLQSCQTSLVHPLVITGLLEVQPDYLLPPTHPSQELQLQSQHQHQ